MSTPQVAFTANYSPELIDEAMRNFRDYRFRRFGPTLVVACVVNAVGLALALWFAARGDAFASPPFLASIALAAIVVVVGPTWLLYQYFLAPSRQAIKLKRLLPSHLRMSVSPTTLWITGKAREIAIPIKVVVETSNLFLVIPSAFECLLVPKAGLPIEAHEVLHGRSLAARVAANGERMRT